MWMCVYRDVHDYTSPFHHCLNTHIYIHEKPTGHETVVRSLLAAGADPNAANASGRTALQVRCLCVCTHECWRLKLKKVFACLQIPPSVPLNQRRMRAPILIHSHTHIPTNANTHKQNACHKGHAPIVKLLLSAGARMNTRARNGRVHLYMHPHSPTLPFRPTPTLPTLTCLSIYLPTYLPNTHAHMNTQVHRSA